MKTLILPFALLFATSLMAQEKKMKVCINIDENKNGVVQKIDTCFESTSHEEIEAFLQRMGVENHIQIGEGSHSEMKTIVIKQDAEMDKSDKKHKEHRKHEKDGNQHEEIIIQMDENGNMMTNNNDAKVIIKHMEISDEEIQKEIDSLMKMVQQDGGKTPIVKKEIRVYVSKKVMINSLTEDDKKTLPQSLQKKEGQSFDNFEVYPNPAVDKVNVKFKNDGGEIKIKLYDAQGQVLLADQYKNSDKEFNREFELSELPKGIYFLHIEQCKKSEVKKLVISE